MEGVSSSLCRFSWSHTCLYHGASETDLISVAGAASFQLLKLCSDMEGLIFSSLSKPRTLFLLLGSGGLSLWILYRKKEGASSSVECTPKSQSVSWLRWLFSEEEKDFFLFREEPSPLRAVKTTTTTIAPCPNCQRGVCRLRKHQQMSYGGRRGHYLPPTSTPDFADDENSDSEEFIYLHFGGRRRRSGSWMSTSSSFISNRSDGEGMSDPSLNRSGNIYYPTAKLYSASKRLPGDGMDGCVGGPSSLSSGEQPCDCTECLSLSTCRYEREESVDSIISATGSMVELIKGAREVRKLIREASFDSLTSDISFNQKEAPSIRVVDSSSPQETGEEEGVPPCLRINQSLNKNFYSMIALSSLDFEPSSSGVNSLEWESPQEEGNWHDARDSKYKMSLPPESDVELEWDAEITLEEDLLLPSGVNSFVSGLELDMESELLRGPSACSSRRSSFGAAMGKRLPPSGRSSAERDLSEPPNSEECSFPILTPLIEEPPSPTKNSNNTRLKVPSRVSSSPLYISLEKGGPPDNIEILNNNRIRP